MTGTSIEIQEKTKATADNLFESVKEFTAISQTQSAASQSLATIAQTLAAIQQINSMAEVLYSLAESQV